ncbi:MAG: hypothetical protein ACR2KZ_23050 [Segetibacter sp.]
MVFALNTVVGFACSVSVDMGFNSKHHSRHKEATEAVVHVHKNGKEHVHQEKKESPNHDKSHHRDDVDNHSTSGSDKDNCCNDKVTKFEQLDKFVPQPETLIHPVFFTAFVATYYNSNVLPHADTVKDFRQFLRSYHPPITDIRIAIQSFQI